MDCIDLFKRAAMALQTDPRYLAMDQARKMNDKDEELQNLIGEFNLARMDLNNEIGKTERSDARIAELNDALLPILLSEHQSYPAFHLSCTALCFYPIESIPLKTFPSPFPHSDT